MWLKELKDGTPLDIYCFDLTFGKTSDEEELKRLGFYLNKGDITEGIPMFDEAFERATARFGIKNYAKETQLAILRDVKRVLWPDGYFVLIDMYSPEASFDWQQTERRHKSTRTFGEANSTHHIPTLNGWYEILREAGLEPDTVDVYQTVSKVTPRSSWVPDQMGLDGAIEHEQWLLQAPEHVRRDYNIRQEEVEIDEVPTTVTKIDYPVVVIGAKKLHE